MTQRWAHQLVDSDGLAGFQREQQSLDGGSMVASTIHAPTVVQNLYQSPAGSIDPIGDTPHTAVLPPPQDNTAVVTVLLPRPNAAVWFDGCQ